jgi:hypothetical protein
MSALRRRQRGDPHVSRLRSSGRDVPGAGVHRGCLNPLQSTQIQPSTPPRAAENGRCFGIRSASSQASFLSPPGFVIRRGAAERSRWIGKLNRKSRKKRWRHLHRQFFKQPDRTRYVTIAQMHDRQVDCAKVPFRHDFNKPPAADQLRLHHRRKIADATPANKTDLRPV